MTDPDGCQGDGGAMSSAHLTIDAAPATIGDWRELASREDNGLEIRLLWSKSAERVKVAVLDQRLGESFDLDIAGADALSAFYHPFAHLAAESSESAMRCASPSTRSRRTERSL